MTRAGIWLSFVLAAACVDTNTPYGVTAGAGTQGHHSSGATASAGGITGGTTGGVGSGTTAAGSTGTSGASSGGGQCLTTPAGALEDCGDGGLLEYRTRLEVGFSASLTPVTAPVQITDLLNPAFQADTDPCGNLVLCVPPGTDLALDTPMGNSVYGPTLFGDILLVDAGINQDKIALIPSGVIAVATSGVTNYDSSAAAVVIIANEVDHGIGCPNTGWTFVLYDLDGGVVDAGFVFPSGTGISSQTSTTTDGIAVAYNVNPMVGQITVIGFNDAGADAGGSCPYDGKVRGLTGWTHVLGSYVSIAPYTLP